LRAVAGQHTGEQPDTESVQPGPVARGRVLTVPNLLTLARLLAIAVFVWLLLGPREDDLALAALVIAGVTDFLDGFLARRLGQDSKVGRILDPVADRLYVLVVVIGLAVRDVIPWWLAVALPLRDVLLVGLVPLLRTRGLTSLPVHYLGKAATFMLLFAFPLLLLAHRDGDVAAVARVFGWALAIWGVAVYWTAGAFYAGQVGRLLRMTPRVRGVRGRV
jgi:cardiolipin synthase